MYIICATYLLPLFRSSQHAYRYLVHTLMRANVTSYLEANSQKKMIEMESLRLYFRIVLLVISDAFDVILSGGHSGVQLIITYFLNLLDYAERTFAYFLTENLGQIVGPLLCALSDSFSRYIS